MRRTVVVAFSAILLLGGALAGVANADTGPVRYLVGYDPAEASQASLAIQLAGGTIERTSPEIGVALVTTDDPQTFHFVADNSPWIDYVEANDAIALSGGQWNGAQWNGAQWNGAQWNGAQWNGAQWNGGQWNGESWSAPQQDATRWTIAQWAQNKPTGWSYDTESSDPGLAWQWGAWASRSVAAPQGNGDAKLCVLDSGVAWDHPDIAPNYVEGWNAIDPTASAYDDGGHGTHIAGLAAGASGNAFGIAGVANVGILNAKVLDSQGQGEEGDLAFALVWCALRGADVAVMALSATDDGPSMDRALQFAADHDVLLLASAGNTGAAVAYPASDPRVAAVGAVDGELRGAPFSATGAEVDLAAPGVNVLGPLPGDAFAFGSGTSQAVAVAAGVASLVRDANGALSADEALDVLTQSARDLGTAGRDATFGHGLVDATAAVALAREP